MDNKQPETKFLHFRYSGINEKGETEIFARGGLTIAFREIEPGLIEHAYAKCHINDNFNKVTARNKAGGRLLSPKHAKQFKGTEQDLVNAVETDVENYNHYSPYSLYQGLTLGRKYNGKRKYALGLNPSFDAADVVIETINQTGGIIAAEVNA